MKSFVATVLTIASLLTGSAIAAAADDSAALVSNGNFELDADTDQQPDGWPVKDGVSWEKEEDGNHFIRLKTTEPGLNVMVYKAVPLKPENKALELKYRVRYENIKQGAEMWFDGRIMMNFKDAEEKVVKPSPKAPSFKGTSKDWKERKQQFLVPEGAKFLEVMLTLFKPESGQLDFDDISITPIDPAELTKAAAAAAAAAVPTRSFPELPAIIPVPAADKMPKELHVVGNQIKDADGKTIWLQGVAIPSMEWTSTGEHITRSVEIAITEWNANCIRLPVKETYWFGTDKSQKDGGEGYRQVVDNAVNLTASHGAYLVLDLHRFRAPNDDHVKFWKDAAARYKNNPAVLIELFNEPHGISWEVWRDGGQVTDEKKGATDALTENTEVVTGFHSPGMQKMVDAVREIGAKNIIIAGGLDWSYDLGGILKGFALDDKGGNGIVYSTHVYPWKSKWQERFLDVAERYPIFVGEVGAPNERYSFIPADRHEDPYTWSPDMVALIQHYKLHWTAWAFHPKAGPPMLNDWNYTPTKYWGEFAKRALAGEQFEMKRMR